MRAATARIVAGSQASRSSPNQSRCLPPLEPVISCELAARRFWRVGAVDFVNHRNTNPMCVGHWLQAADVRVDALDHPNISGLCGWSFAYCGSPSRLERWCRGEPGIEGGVLAVIGHVLNSAARKIESVVVPAFAPLLMRFIPVALEIVVRNHRNCAEGDSH